MTTYSIEQLKSQSDKYPILLFDKDCILCSRFVQWIIRQDRKSRIRFLGLQQVEGDPFMIKGEYDTVILFHKNEVSVKSDVTFQVLSILGGLWYILLPFKWVPRLIRDNIYMIVSKNRYKWFGKEKNCLLMTEEISGRFL